MPSWDGSLEGWTMEVERLGKFKRFRLMWRHGREDHFPICCVLRFSIESALSDGKSAPATTGAAVRRGTVTDYRRSMSPFVPCNIFHRKTHNY